MKAWKLDGTWMKTDTEKTHKLKFLVVAEDNEDPVEVVKKLYDMSGMTYLNGVVEYQELPFAKMI